MSYALAISAAQPIRAFQTPGELARAILDRPGNYQRHTLHIAACWGREGRGEPAIAVYGHGDRVGFVGYAIGLGHDREALGAILQAAKAGRPHLADDIGLEHPVSGVRPIRLQAALPIAVAPHDRAAHQSVQDHREVGIGGRDEGRQFVDALEHAGAEGGIGRHPPTPPQTVSNVTQPGSV